jgi:hypothetical protein
MVERTPSPATSSAGAQGGRLAAYLEGTELAELLRSFGGLPEVVRTGLVTVVAAAIFLLTTSEERTDFDYFVRLADAFLHGRLYLLEAPSWLNELVPGGGGWYVVYPPVPAIMLMPFVAIFGTEFAQNVASCIFAAITVGLAWLLFGRFVLTVAQRLMLTAVFGFGTVFWYAAQLGTTWFFAHVCAVTFLLLAIGVALRSDPSADAEPSRADGAARAIRSGLTSLPRRLARPLALIDRNQFLAGLLFGIACTARLTVVFGAPFFMLVGGGGSWVRRSFSAGLGAAIPVALLLAYNLGTTGQVLHPGYEGQYRKEAVDYEILGYHADWDIEDLRYLPQNLGIMLLSTPAVLPERELDIYGQEGEPLCQGEGRSLFDPACPIAVPRAIGMSILLTSPAYLLAGWALFRRRSRLVAGAALAVAAIAFVNLLHFSQGWVNFGYRFSNDFVVFALPLVAIGMARRGGVGWLGVGLIALSVAINLWGVIWGNVLGW